MGTFIVFVALLVFMVCWSQHLIKYFWRMGSKKHSVAIGILFGILFVYIVWFFAAVCHVLEGWPFA